MKRLSGALALCLTALVLGAGSATAEPVASTAMSVNPACAPLKQRLSQATTKKARKRIKAKLRAEACPGY